MGYHGRYYQLVYKLACHPKLWFQISCITAFPTILCLHWLLVARRQGWRAPLSNQGGSVLCTRDSKTLMIQRWVIYYLRLVEMMLSFVFMNYMVCSWFIVHQHLTTCSWSYRRLVAFNNFYCKNCIILHIIVILVYVRPFLDYNLVSGGLSCL